jgi:hypothetical protein
VVTNEAGEKLSKQTRAIPVAKADGKVLRTALRFLGQPWELPGPPREMLDAAAKSWDFAAMTGRDTM